MADLPATGPRSRPPRVRIHRPAPRPGTPHLPRHAHRGTLLPGTPGPLQRRRTPRRDHHGLRPRIRLHRPQRGSGGRASLAALPAGRPRRAGQQAPVPGRLEQGRGKDFRILMLDQRGTGLSSPIDRNTLPLRGNDAAQARYLSHFRADSIVADAEAIRSALGSGALDRLRPELRRILRPQLPLLRARRGCARCSSPAASPRWRGPADRVYRATFQRVAARNAEYFSWYPEDRAAVTRIARHLRDTEEFLPDGEPPHRRALPDGGLLPGRQHPGGCASTTCWRTPSWPPPTATASRTRFLEQVRGLVSRAANPLYALMHESIYGQCEATDWAAWRVLAGIPRVPPRRRRAAADRRDGLPLVLRAGPGAAPAAGAWHGCWPRRTTGSRSTIRTGWPSTPCPWPPPCTRDDIYVDRELSLETAAAVRGLQVWESDGVPP